MKSIDLTLAKALVCGYGPGPRNVLDRLIAAARRAREDVAREGVAGQADRWQIPAPLTQQGAATPRGGNYARHQFPSQRCKAAPTARVRAAGPSPLPRYRTARPFVAANTWIANRSAMMQDKELLEAFLGVQKTIENFNRND